MKIVILSDDFPPKSYGGAGIVAFEQARELVQRGHEVIVITTTQERDDKGEVYLEGVLVHKIYANYQERFRAYLSLYNPQTISSVEKFLRDIKPDVVHAHNVHFYLSYYVLVLARRYSKKVILTAHDVMMVHYGKLVPRIVLRGKNPSSFDYRISGWQQFSKYRFRYNPFRNFAIQLYLKNVDKILAVSNATSEVLRQNGICNVDVLYNAIDVERFLVSAEKVKSYKDKYSLENKKVMFFGGRISVAKGGEVAFNILEQVHRALPDVFLLIAGTEDDYTRGLLRAAKEKGLASSIVFTGWLSREEMPTVYAASNLVLYLSLYADPFGLVNLEAMATRKPVLGTCFGGTPEVVVDGQTGYIVDPNKLEQASTLALKILRDEELATRFGEAGYLRAKDKFSLTKQIDILEKYYEAPKR